MLKCPKQNHLQLNHINIAKEKLKNEQKFKLKEQFPDIFLNNPTPYPITTHQLHSFSPSLFVHYTICKPTYILTCISLTKIKGSGQMPCNFNLVFGFFGRYCCVELVSMPVSCKNTLGMRRCRNGGRSLVVASFSHGVLLRQSTKEMIGKFRY